MNFSDLEAKRIMHLLGGGKEKLEEQRKKGQLTATERINALFDTGSFEEIDPFVIHNCNDFGMENKKILGDGVITGYGRIDSRLVYSFCHDFTVLGGSLGLSFASKICKIMDHALKQGVPIIGINDSGGARIQEGVESLGGYADIFHRNVRVSGIIPQISLIMGPCAGGAVYSPALTDFIIMTKSAYMFVTGPDVVRQVSNENVTSTELGGASIHNEKSGVAHFVADDEYDCFEILKKLLSFIPSNNLESSPKVKSTDSSKILDESLDSILPSDSHMSYSMENVIRKVVDKEDFFEVQKFWARNIISGFARIDGNAVGIVANNPEILAGVLDIDSCNKAARFVRFCDCFNIPIITFVDVPGFLPGTDQEWRGIIRHGAKLLFAFSEATVPRLSVITRKAYGGAYDVMNSKHIGGDYNFAWPNAEIAVMGAESACNIIFRKELSISENKHKRRSELVSDYEKKFSNPYIAASKGYIDNVIMPRETRQKLISALNAINRKREDLPKRKHGNMPI
jgi:propionyl-CoA carboxylase beta chain